VSVFPPQKPETQPPAIMEIRNVKGESVSARSKVRASDEYGYVVFEARLTALYSFPAEGFPIIYA
jgi:hypothetical protein